MVEFFFMKNEPKRIKFPLAILTAFLLAVYPVYFQYNDIVEIDFLSPFSSFENPDQENLPSDKQNKIKIFAQGFSSAISLVGFSLTEPLPDFSPRIFYLDEITSVLRC